MPEFKGTWTGMLAEKYHQIMPSGSNENARKSIKKMAKTLAVSKGKVYRDISMLAGKI